MSTFTDTIDVVLELLQDVNTPRSLCVSMLITYGEWDQLVDLTIDPAHYLTADSYLADACVTEILRKCELPGVSADIRRSRAYVKWVAAEKQCAATNVRFANYISGFFPGVDGRVVDFLYRVKKRIGRVLGRLPDDLVHCRHGKGATYHDVGRNCTVLHKMQSQPTITKEAYGLLPLLEESAWMRAVIRRESSDCLVVRGNRFVTVPKTSKIDRSIAVEPSVNVYLQLGIGQIIRRRLKSHAGIDLDDGQTKHRALASDASVNNALATLDLSSASDTVSLNVVHFLLPSDWFLLLASTRSPVTEVDGHKFVLSKFSSMGNGFTFELETLIFWAICSELAGESTHVYGDDIIVPVASAQDCIGALQFFGFIINETKSYTSGRFRESCGGDFFDGFPVRPFYLKELPHEPTQWISFANGLWRLNRLFTDGCGFFDHRVRRAYLRCLGNIPSDIRRLKGPSDLGDLCLNTDDSSTWRCRVKHGILQFEVYQPVQKHVSLLRFDPDVQLAAALYGVSSEGALPRSNISGYRKRWIPDLKERPGRRLHAR